MTGAQQQQNVVERSHLGRIRNNYHSLRQQGNSVPDNVVTQWIEIFRQRLEINKYVSIRYYTRKATAYSHHQIRHVTASTETTRPFKTVLFPSDKGISGFGQYRRTRSLSGTQR